LPIPSIAIPAPTFVSTERDARAGAVVHAVPGDADVTGLHGERADVDDDAVRPGLLAEPVDRVRVDGRVGAHDDAGPGPRDPVPPDLERAAGRDGSGRRDAGLL
jgi:hypothetical protein